MNETGDKNPQYLFFLGPNTKPELQMQGRVSGLFFIQAVIDDDERSAAFVKRGLFSRSITETIPR